MTALNHAYLMSADWGRYDTDARVSFPTPGNNGLYIGTGAQEFRVLVRQKRSTGGSVVCRVELWESGVLKQTIVANTTVTSAAVLSGTFNAGDLTDTTGAGVECKVVGYGNIDNAIEVGAIEWNVSYYGGDVTRVLTDTLSANDAYTKAQGFNRSQSSATTIADAATRARTRSLTDALSAADAYSRVLVMQRTLNDAESISDALLRARTRLTTDTEAATDILALRTIGRSPLDTLTTSDRMSQLKNFYSLAGFGSTPNLLDFQEDGTQPSSATFSPLTAWKTVDASTIIQNGQSAEMVAQTSVPSGSSWSLESANPKPLAPNATIGNAWRSPTALNGTFRPGDWRMTVVVTATNNNVTAEVRFRFRIWRSINANGSSATEVTTAAMVTDTNVGTIGTSDIVGFSVTQNISDNVVLNNEYLFVTAAMEIVTKDNADVANRTLGLRTSGNSGLKTPVFARDYIEPRALSFSGLDGLALADAYSKSRTRILNDAPAILDATQRLKVRSITDTEATSDILTRGRVRPFTDLIASADATTRSRVRLFSETVPTVDTMSQLHQLYQEGTFTSGRLTTLQDGGTAPADGAYPSRTGWFVYRSGGGVVIQPGDSAEVLMRDEVTGSSSAVFSPETSNPKPQTPNSTIGNGWRSSNTYTGIFRAGQWSFNVVTRSYSAVANGTVRLRFRVWRSTSATGSGSAEITTGAVTTNTVTYTDTTTPVTMSGSFTLPQTTLNNEYIFVTLALEVVTASGSGGTSRAIEIRENPGSFMMTPVFSSGFSGSIPYQFTLNDLLALADAYSTARGMVIKPNDALAIADAYGIGRGLTRKDTISAADTYISVNGRQVKDTLAMADSLLRSRARSATETLSAIDAYTKAQGIKRTLSDAAALADAYTRQLQATFNDALILADAYNASIGRTRSFNDTLSLVDYSIPELSLSLDRTFNDALATSDATQRAINVFRSRLDTLATADAYNSAITFVIQRTVNDILGATDSAAVTKDMKRLLAEAVLIADAYYRQHLAVRTIHDELAFIELFRQELIRRAFSVPPSRYEDVIFEDRFSDVAREVRFDDVEYEDRFHDVVREVRFDDVEYEERYAEVT